MLTGIKRVILADVASVQDMATGDRTKVVSRAKVILKHVELVGIQTVQVGQIQGFNLTFSITVPRIMYDNEKLLYFSGELYEVKTMGKAKLPTEMLLNVQESSDIEAKKAVEVWINENL